MTLTPYYAFCYSYWLPFEQLKARYLQAVRLDQTRLILFGWYHWEFAMKAAKEGLHTEASDAFRRAMIVNPEQFENGLMSVRPSSGAALSRWNEAKGTMSSYRSDFKKMNDLWLVGEV